MDFNERDLNVPGAAGSQTPPAQKAAQASKLPRRVATPSSVPSTPQLVSSSSARRSALARNTASDSRTPSDTKGSNIAEPLRHKQSSSLTPSPSISTFTDKPLPHEKPLPPRPIARLSNMPSPSKDSRGLIDAHDQPLHVATPDGEKREWPTLTPQSGASTRTISEDDPKDSEANPGSDSDSGESDTKADADAIAAATDAVTNVADVKSSSELTVRDRRSYSESSYATANESPTVPPSNKRPSLITRRSLQTLGMSPQRPRSALSRAHTLTRTTSLRNRTSSGSLITPVPGVETRNLGFTDFTNEDVDTPTSSQSRTSTTNFSRPRPESVISVGTKSIKTASRLPIPDSKKATMVTLNKDRTSDSSTGYPSAPRFGSRRIASPNALRVLENGKLRREKQQTKGAESPLGIPLRRRSTFDSETSIAETPSLSHSLDTSPEGTLAPSSPELIAQLSVAPKLGAQSTLTRSRTAGGPSGSQDLHTQYAEARDDGLFLDNTDAELRVPPSTSLFTAPLQTIKSEALLPTDENGFQDAVSSDDNDMEKELERTLSQLEGKGTPPNMDIDERAMYHMFENAKIVRPKESRSNPSMYQSAAAAEKYLPTKQVSPTPANTLIWESHGHDNPSAENDQGQSSHRPFNSGKQPVRSKWSDSTPSDKAASPPSDAISPNDIASIGYPYCVPFKGDKIGNNEGAAISSISSRRSSTTVPSLDKRKPGSVAAARQGLRSTTTPGFARATAAAQSRMTTRLPTPSPKTNNMAQTFERGRTVSSNKNRSEIDLPKTRRSRSKSRIVLDKINGLFSGRRERKSEDVPPVPRIEHLPAAFKENVKPIQHKRPLTPRDNTPAGLPQIPAMPRLPAPPPAPLRSHPVTTVAQAEGISLQDESHRIQTMVDRLVERARGEANAGRQKQHLDLAQVLSDCMVKAREAAISAERAQSAANEARGYFEMTLRGLSMVQKMAAGMRSTQRR